MLTSEQVAALEGFLEGRQIPLQELQDHIHKQDKEIERQALLKQQHAAEERCEKLLGKCFRKIYYGTFHYYKVIGREASPDDVFCLYVPELEVVYNKCINKDPYLLGRADIHKMKVSYFYYDDMTEITEDEFESRAMKYMRKFVEVKL